MACERSSSRFCDTWKVNSKGILIRKNNTKLAMKVNAYLERKKITTICWWLLSCFCWDLLGPFTRKAYIKMLSDCNLVPKNTQHLLKRGLKPSGWGALCQWETRNWSSLTFKAWEHPLVVWGKELMVHWAEKLPVGSLWSQGPSFPVNSCERKLPLVPKTFRFSWFSRSAFECWRRLLKVFCVLCTE